MKKALYIASPLGFSEIGKYFMENKLFPLIRKFEYGIIDPWELTPFETVDPVSKMDYGIDKKEAWKKINPIIGENNRMGIDNSIGLIAILDGVDVDSGTASEIGYAAAKSKPILGYRGDFRLASDNEGSLVNLQVEYFIRMNGGDIVANLNQITEELLNRIFIPQP